MKLRILTLTIIILLALQYPRAIGIAPVPIQETGSQRFAQTSETEVPYGGSVIFVQNVGRFDELACLQSEGRTGLIENSIRITALEPKSEEAKEQKGCFSLHPHTSAPRSRHVLVPRPITLAYTDSITLPFRDDFNGSLSPGWRIVNQDSSKYNLHENYGHLRIYTTRSDTWGTSNSLINLFALAIPQGIDSLTVTTKMSFPILPSVHAQQGGIILLADSNGQPDMDNYYRVTYGYFDGVRSPEAVREVNGSPVVYRGRSLEIGTSPIWIRIVKNLDSYSGFFSLDGIDYIPFNSITGNWSIAYVGMVALNSNADPSIPVDFDFVEIRATSGLIVRLSGPKRASPGQLVDYAVYSRTALLGWWKTLS